MNKNMDREAQIAAAKFADDLLKYPVEVAIGVGLVIRDLPNGCSWTFVTNENDEYTKILDRIAKNPNMSSYKVHGGYLFNINMNYLLDILGKVATGWVTREDLQIATSHRQDSLRKLDAFMRKGNVGKIGIYNLNDKPRITVDGTSYSAFCVTLPDLLEICVRNGYKLKLGRRVVTPGVVAENILKIIEHLEVAPSGNALFVEITK